MKRMFSKIGFVLREEGPRILLVRAFRYAVYVMRRAGMDGTSDRASWHSIKGRFRGKRAFLIGNGPSLNQTPLYLLKDEFVLCANRFDLMLERLDWMPLAYVVSDDRVLADTLDVVRTMASRMTYAFFPDLHPSAPFSMNFQKLIEGHGNIYWLHLDSFGFSDDLPVCGLNKTVTNVGLQILAYLGFTNIYLLGVDMQYEIPPGSLMDNRRDIVGGEDNDVNHFDPRYFGKGRAYHVPRLDETFRKFEEARKFFEKRGVHVHNSTVGGKLEIFPRVRLEDVLGLERLEIRKRFLRSLKARLRQETMVESILSDSPLLENPQSGVGRSSFCVRPEDATAFVASHIHTHVPFGPSEDRVFFVSRELLRLVKS